MKKDFKEFHNDFSEEQFKSLLNSNSTIQFPWIVGQEYPQILLINTVFEGMNYWCVTYSGLTGWGMYYFRGDNYYDLESLESPCNHVDTDEYRHLFFSW